MVAHGILAQLGGILATAALAAEGPVSQVSLGVPMWLEISAMCVSGFFGGVLAAGRKFPLLGVLISGLIVGLGGGVIRDVLLNVMPVAIGEEVLLPAVGISALAGGLCSGVLAESRISVVGLQALSLGLLLVIGSEKAANFHVSVWGIIALGIITAAAGGAMLDALSGMRAALLSQGRWHVTALAAGAAGFIVLSHTASTLVAEIGAVTLVVVLHLVSLNRGWSCPELPGPREAEH